MEKCALPAAMLTLAAPSAVAASVSNDLSFLAPPGAQVAKPHSSSTGLGQASISEAPRVPASEESAGSATVAAAAAAATAGLGAVAGASRTRRQRRARHGRPSGAVALRGAGEASATAVVEKGLSPADVLERYVKEKGGDKAIRKILIANNGMAATKAILSLRQWAYLEFGMDNVFEFVAMATPEDLDANAEFIRLADTYVPVPGGKNVNNYANVDLICQLAKQYEVDAVWPGWGHASENPKLPAGLKELGISFIGPTAPVMSVLGDKIAANILAQTAGVPSIPWSGDGLEANLTDEGTIPDEVFKKGTITSLEEAIACADRIGYPVMLKASEGGGGKGIRMSANKEELTANYPQVTAEVPGSPVFMMQLCQGARHIEVQIVGDRHGKAVALNGRDCSTQRRFQKIFEEGPPSIVPKDTFTEMERAAQRLTQNIGYIGAGTVEYLYNAQTNSFFFLELNPRLQVEHPVTEQISGVNLPATQVQVIMGIPLDRIPQVRDFYGKSADDTSGIDFLEEHYVYPTKHIIAARITAENPDDGFKPTSGKIERVKFQSAPSCWGYFSVGANGGIHEYADSQFGHIFANGANREDARKALTLALKNMNVIGEIRNPVEFLVELANTQAFRENTIDTAWLDGIIKEKSMAAKYRRHDVVFYAAVFRATEASKAKEAELLATLGKSQFGPIQSIGDLNEFPIEIAFEGEKFNFKVQRCGPENLLLTVGDQSIMAKVRTQPDGSLFVTVGDSVTTVMGTEEALGLRLQLGGVGTIMLPTLYDPSELRSEFNGKIVRYIQDDGGAVKQGEPYVELEAMKMIMPVKAGASGRVSHAKGVGSIVSAGDILGTLELDDPSSVQKIVPFNGALELSTLTEAPVVSAEDLRSQIDLVLDGYSPSVEPSLLAQRLFAETPQEDYNEVSVQILEKYLEVEERFAKLATAGMKTPDQMYGTLVSENKDDLGKVVALALAHSHMADRNEIILGTLRDVRWGRRDSTEGLLSCLDRLQQLPSDMGYAEVALLAGQVAQKVTSTPFEERVAALRKLLAPASPDYSVIVKASAAKAGVEVIGDLLGDEASYIRADALESYVRRVYRSANIPMMCVHDQGPSQLTCEWKFQYAGVSQDESKSREGFCVVIPNLGELENGMKNELPFEDSRDGSNHMHIIVGPDAFPSVSDKPSFYSTDGALPEVIQKVESLLEDKKEMLEAKGVREFHVSLLQKPHVPRSLNFTALTGWKEDPLRRDMRPTISRLMEVRRLASEYDLTRISPVIGRNSLVYLGTRKGQEVGKRGPPKTIFARMITHSMKEKMGEEGWSVWPESLMLSALDEIERARLNPKVGQAPSSNIFCHFMWIAEMAPKEAGEQFEQFLNEFVAKHIRRLQQMKVDEIVCKVGLSDTSGKFFLRQQVDEYTTNRTHTLRLTASSMAGEYLKVSSMLETEDPDTGMPQKFIDIQSGQECDLAEMSGTSLQNRRAVARAAGSTYVPEFLGMMKLELIKRWSEYGKQMDGKVETPDSVFESKELVAGTDGVLGESDRAPGQNTIGMIAWICTMRTPEYPAGRQIVLIANDVTYQAGSFGVAEDEFFQKASEYAREHGLPRIHIACNSGARVGLVEELKPYVKAMWTDPEDPSKGFEYLYLEEEDYKRFGEGVVEVREVTANGSKVYAIDTIIGNGLKSTAGGIGVENLRGSGLIAGETSKAYNEVFTLSYITGRSVGIGAYLNRLGQRTIQMAQGPMILTGFGALNKLLGRTVYTSQDQLGGPQVMVPNGVTHQLVRNDTEGVSAILKWLSYVPKDCFSSASVMPQADPVERDVTFTPTKSPYDPRHMLAGSTTESGERLTGFFDEGSFQETLSGWGKSVVVGRAKLGGVPMGVIAVETRSVERRIPADPANPASMEVIEPQAGQVWFPDSAFKTATAIRDFNRGENLPLIIFANWRGFSGGTRDMYSEVLKFGAQIVDALVEYKHPVFVYIPPAGELRGGSWVVIDPTINPDQMEMYADVESRGGILEPAGIVEVKFRAQQQIELMHRLDPELQKLDASGKDDDDTRAQIKAREEKLLPLYTQIACEFADLHDRAGRMESKGVIRGALKWSRSREFFYWRVRARLLEQEVVRRVQAADPSLSVMDARNVVKGWLPGEDDKTVVAFLEKDGLDAEVEKMRVEAIKRRVQDLLAQLPDSERKLA